MDIRVMRYFLAVAREGNVTRAAAALHVTHVAVEGDKLVLQLPGNDRWLMPGGRHPRLHLHDPDARLAEIAKRLLKLLPSALSFPPLPFPYPP